MKAINSFLQYRPNAEWIRESSGLPWLELELAVPVDVILREFETVKHRLVKHRSGDVVVGHKHAGWKSMCIYGVNTETTTNSDKQHNWTDIAENCSYTVAWIKENFVIDDKTGRMRFMYLEPGGYILPHTDKTKSRLTEINIAITHPKGCVFRFLDKGNIPFEPGKAFIIDTSNRHMVFNNSNKPRLHMIMHTKISDETIVESYEKSYYC